ncbi:MULTISPECIES: septum formation family protein [unclassified Microbacterium]|uniref:septum formation family protein n=1 Tax=unclassified Microbacterium TaxID=2609290 RepID=UPI002004D5C6|nr:MULTISPECIES: septum formation family protein [unclassified Microbacterium]
MSTRARRAGLLGAAGLLLAAPVLVGCSEAIFYEMSGMVYRDASGEITVGGELDVYDLEVGDCFDESSESDPDVPEDSVSSVAAIPCDDPHTYEVYHVFTLPNGEYPGDDAVAAEAEEGCLNEFGVFVRAPYEDSPLEFSYYVPAEGGWDGTDRDRTIQCLLGSDGVSVTGTAEDSGRQAS